MSFTVYRTESDKENGCAGWAVSVLVVDLRDHGADRELQRPTYG